MFAGFKQWVKSRSTLYFLYTYVRYGSRTAIRNWVIKTHRFLIHKDLNTFIFERDGVYVRTNEGYEFEYVPELMGGLLGLEYSRGFETDELQELLSLLSSDAVVIDIGANFGMYSVAIAVEKSQSVVHAFEPLASTAKLLQSNLDRNRVADRVLINKCAVGKEPGNLFITADRYAGNYILNAGVYSGEKTEVQVINLDNYSLDQKMTRIDLIKCDVEGAEFLVMQGAEHVLKKFKPIVMLEIAPEWTKRFGYNSKELISYMNKQGYCCKRMGSGKGVSREISPNDVETHNYLFKPKAV